MLKPSAQTDAEQAWADRCERLGEELYRGLAPLHRPLALSLLATLLEAAGQLREGPMGAQASDLRLIVDTEIGREVAAFFLEWHRGQPLLEMRSRVISDEELGRMFSALHMAEQFGGADEHLQVLAATPVDVQAWLNDAAVAARATATAYELARWRDAPPMEIAAELLTRTLRAVLRVTVDGLARAE